MAEGRFTMIRVDELLQRVQIELADAEDHLAGLSGRPGVGTRVLMLSESVRTELASMREALQTYQHDVPANVAETFVQFPLEPKGVPGPPPDPLSPHGVAAWLLQRTHYLQKLFQEAGDASTTHDVRDALRTVSLQVEAFGRKVSRTQQSVAEI
jgi:hypothetical protein